MYSTNSNFIKFICHRGTTYKIKVQDNKQNIELSWTTNKIKQFKDVSKYV